MPPEAVDAWSPQTAVQPVWPPASVRDRAALREVARQRRARFVRYLQSTERWESATRTLGKHLVDTMTARTDVVGTCLVPAAFGDEPDLDTAARRLESEGWTIARPLIRPAKDTFDAVVWPARGPLREGVYGVPEPALSGPTLQGPAQGRHQARAMSDGTLLPPEEVDVILVPGLVFDPRGHRLGYGGGMFDRFLDIAGRGTDAPLVIGYAWSVARYPHALPHEAHDREVPVLVCEDGVHATT